MFNFLKKKLSSWISKPKKEKTEASKSKKTRRAEKKKRTPAEETAEVEKIIEEAEKGHNIEEAQKELEEQGGNFFTKLIKKITTSKLSKEDFGELFMELEITLLENNVALEAVDKIK